MKKQNMTVVHYINAQNKKTQRRRNFLLTE